MGNPNAFFFLCSLPLSSPPSLFFSVSSSSLFDGFYFYLFIRSDNRRLSLQFQFDVGCIKCEKKTSKFQMNFSTNEMIAQNATKMCCWNCKKAWLFLVFNVHEMLDARLGFQWKWKWKLRTIRSFKINKILLLFYGFTAVFNDITSNFMRPHKCGWCVWCVY